MPTEMVWALANTNTPQERLKRATWMLTQDIAPDYSQAFLPKELGGGPLFTEITSKVLRNNMTGQYVTADYLNRLLGDKGKEKMVRQLLKGAKGYDPLKTAYVYRIISEHVDMGRYKPEEAFGIAIGVSKFLNPKQLATFVKNYKVASNSDAAAGPQNRFFALELAMETARNDLEIDPEWLHRYLENRHFELVEAKGVLPAELKKRREEFEELMGTAKKYNDEKLQFDQFKHFLRLGDTLQEAEDKSGFQSASFEYFDPIWYDIVPAKHFKDVGAWADKTWGKAIKNRESQIARSLRGESFVYKDAFNDVLRQARVDRDAWRDSLHGKLFSGLGSMYNAGERRVQGYAFKAGKWIYRGLQEVSNELDELTGDDTPFFTDNEIARSWKQLNADENEIFTGGATLGDKAMEAGMPSYLAAFVDIGTMWVADPIWWGTGAFKAMRMARSIDNVTRRVHGIPAVARFLADTKIIGNFPKAKRALTHMGLAGSGNVREWWNWFGEAMNAPIRNMNPLTNRIVRKLTGKSAIGQTTLDVLISARRAANESKKGAHQWKMLGYMFHGLKDRTGFKPQAWDLVGKFIDNMFAQGAKTDEMKDTLTRLFRAFAGEHPEEGSDIARVLQAVRRKEDTLNFVDETMAGIHDVYTAFDPDLELPRWARWIGRDGVDLEKVDELFTNALSELNLRIHSRTHSIPFFGGAMRSSRVSMDMLMSDNAIGKTWRTLSNLRPSAIANVEEDFDRWISQVLRRADVHSANEIAVYEEQARDVTQAFRKSNRTEDFLALIDNMENEIWSKSGKRYGLADELTEAIRKSYQKKHRREGLSVMGVESEATLKAIEEGGLREVAKALRAIRHPTDTTQLLNQWAIMDPLTVQSALKDAAGRYRLIGNAVKKALGIDVKTLDKGRKAIVSRFIRETTIAGVDAYLKVVKPMLVVSLRYLTRVPLFDEQIRIIILHSLALRMQATRAAGALVKKIHKIRKTKPQSGWPASLTAADERRLSEAVQEVGFETYEDAVEAVKRNIDGSWDNTLTADEDAVRIGLLDERHRKILADAAFDGHVGPSQIFAHHLGAMADGQYHIGKTHFLEEDLLKWRQDHYRRDKVPVEIDLESTEARLDVDHAANGLNDTFGSLPATDPKYVAMEDLVDALANQAQGTLVLDHELFHVLWFRGGASPDQAVSLPNLLMRSELNQALTADGGRVVGYQNRLEEITEAYALWKADGKAFKTLFPNMEDVFKRNFAYLKRAEHDAKKHVVVSRVKKNTRLHFNVEEVHARDLANDVKAGVEVGGSQMWESFAAQFKRDWALANRKDTFGRTTFDMFGPFDENGNERAGYIIAWLGDLINDYSRGPFSQIALKGVADGWDDRRIVNEIIDFMDSIPGESVAQDLGVQLDDYNSMVARAEESLRAVKQVVGFDTAPQFAQTIASRTLRQDVQGLHDLLKEVPVNQRPVIKMADNARESGGNPVTRMIRFVNTTIMQSVTNFAARHPMGRMEHANMYNALVGMAKELGMPMSDDIKRAMNAEARVYAQQRVKKVLFDFTTQSRFGELARFMFPFFQPFAETFMVYGHLLRSNPRAISWVQKLGKIGQETGFIKEEAGEIVIPATFWLAAGPWLNMIFGRPDGTPGFSLSFPLENLSFFMSSVLEVPLPGGGGFKAPFPSMSTPVNWVIQKIVDKLPEGDPGSYATRLRNSVHSYAFQFGEIDDVITGSMPMWMRTMFASQGWVNEDQLKSETLDMQRQLEAMGVTPETIAREEGIPIDQAQKVWVERAKGMAKGFLFQKALMQFTFPASPVIRKPTDAMSDELHLLQGKHGPLKGEELFLKRHEANIGIAIATTQWNRSAEAGVVPLPPNEYQAAVLNSPEFRDHAREDPRWAFMFLTDEIWAEDFDREEFFRQTDRGWRETKSPHAWTDERDVHLGWDTWRAISDTWDMRRRVLQAERIAAGLPLEGLESTSKYQRQYQEYYTKPVEQLRRDHKDWARDFDLNDKLGVDPRLLEDLRQIADHPILQQTSAGKFLEEYFPMRDDIFDEMVRNNISSLRYDTTGLKEEFEKQKNILFEEFGPNAQRVWSYFLKNDLNKVDTYKDLQAERLNPEQLTEVDDWEIGRQLIADDVITTRGLEQTGAYHDMRVYMDKAYDYNGFNPATEWWGGLTESARDDYKEGLIARPFIYWSRFDRETVLGMKTTDAAEQKMVQYSEIRFEIDKWREANPGKSARPLFEGLDQQVIQWLNKDRVFKDYVLKANTWGQAMIDNGIPGVVDNLIEQGGSAGRAWRALFVTVREFQIAAIEKEMTGERDYDDNRAAVFEASKQYIERYAKDQLFEYSATFERQWTDLDRRMGGDSILDSIIPDTFFPLGGFDYAGHTIKPLKVRVP